MTDDELIERLSAISGALYDQPELLAEWSRDWSPYGAKQEVWDDELPLIAISPDSAEDVACVVRLAGEADRPILIRGGGSGMSGALFPLPGAILLDMGGLNVIDAVDEVRRTVQVDAGVFAGELETHLNLHGFTLPVAPHSLNLATIGGLIATRARGLLTGSRGDLAARIEAIELIAAGGERVVETEPAKIDRICGSFGASGAIVSATLRVEPVAPLRIQAYALDAFDAGLNLIQALLRDGNRPAVAAVYDEAESAAIAEALGASGGAFLFLGVDDGASLADDVVAAGGSRLEEAIGEAWWDRRHATDWVIDGNEDEGSIADLVELDAPWPAVHSTVAEMRATLHPLVDRLWTHAVELTTTGARLTFPFFIRERSDARALRRYERLREAMADRGRFGYGPDPSVAVPPDRLVRHAWRRR